MTVVSATEASANFQELINRAEYRGERILIQRHGKAAVAIIGLEDLKLFPRYHALRGNALQEALPLAALQS